MSPGADHLARALAATRADVADAEAVRAIHADPDLAVAYALRGRVAALRGDCVAAAHYYRVAYDRGDHCAETRAALAACVAAAGDKRGAVALRADAALPAMLEPFAELVSMQGPMVRGVLQARLPPAGVAAFLPGDPAGRVSDPPAQAAPPTGRRSAPPRRQRMVSLGNIEATESTPPAPRAPVSYARGAEPARPPATRPSAPTPSSAPQSWLEESHTERQAPRDVGPASWLDGEFFAEVSGGQMAAEPVQLAVDPGVLEIDALSPVTGQPLRAGSQIGRDGSMPEFETPAVAALPPRAAPAPSGPDLLEAIAPLAAAGIQGLRLALQLPGPVITASGQRPQKLGVTMALGLTASELVLCDPESGRGPVRLPLSQLQRMDVVRAGQQVSFTLADGRQLHLDLRSLEARAPTLQRLLVAELGASLRALGAPVVA